MRYPHFDLRSECRHRTVGLCEVSGVFTVPGGWHSRCSVRGWAAGAGPQEILGSPLVDHPTTSAAANEGEGTIESVCRCRFRTIATAHGRLSDPPAKGSPSFRMGSLHPVAMAIHVLPVLATDERSHRMQKAACQGTGWVLQLLAKLIAPEAVSGDATARSILEFRSGELRVFGQEQRTRGSPQWGYPR